jgi:hypothetical protein
MGSVKLTAVQAYTDHLHPDQPNHPTTNMVCCCSACRHYISGTEWLQQLLAWPHLASSCVLTASLL